MPINRCSKFSANGYGGQCRFAAAPGFFWCRKHIRAVIRADIQINEANGLYTESGWRS